MVVFSDEEIIGPFGFDKVAGGVVLGVEGVGGDDGAFDGEGGE